MKVTKHGNAHIKFKCVKCGCEWTAYIAECCGNYRYCPTDPFACYCPECDNYTVSKDTYKEISHDSTRDSVSDS